MDIDAEFAAAECNALRFLLLELTEALTARGALTQADVAASLLRAEWGAEVLDDIEENSPSIKHHHAASARQTTEQWSERFSLEPWLFALRKRHTEWLAAGSPGKAPLYPAEVIEWSRDDDE